LTVAGISSSGTVTVSGSVYATTFANPSDRRLKANVLSLDARAQHIFSLNGVSFNYKRRQSDGAVHAEGAAEVNATHFGFIAQDVEGKFPELVGRASDGMRSVQYSAFVPLIIEGMKGQRAEAAAQQAAQRAEMDALRALVVDRVTSVVSVKGLTGTGAVTGPLDHLVSVKGLTGTGAVTARHDLLAAVGSAVGSAVGLLPRAPAADVELRAELRRLGEAAAAALREEMRAKDAAFEAKDADLEAKVAALEARNTKLSEELVELRRKVAEILKNRGR
jgi:hypothetical protein